MAMSKWLNWTPETPGQGTDKTDKSTSGGFVGSLTEHIRQETGTPAPISKPPDLPAHLDDIRERKAPAFKPKPQSRARHHVVNADFNEEEYQRVKQNAADSGMSMKEFVYQAVMFAQEHMEP